LAKSWNGLEPGVTPKDEVLKRLGEPSRTLTMDGKEVLAYLGPKAPKGTTQTQLTVDPKSTKVERIDVFPAPVIEVETVESSYGSACNPKEPPAADCYVKKLTGDFRTYWLYPRLGLAVFFTEDGQSVQSFSFQVPKNLPAAKAEVPKADPGKASATP
jgi:hypothetical protein